MIQGRDCRCRGFKVRLPAPLFLTLFLCLNLLVAGLTSVRAQEQSKKHINLYSLQTGSFPTITMGVDIFDSVGSIVPGVQAHAITLLEDNQPRPIDAFDELHPGVQFALALDPGPTFAYRDADAVTRFTKIMGSLKDSASKHSDATGDDLSFIPTYGVSSAHLASSAAFLDALKAYQPDLQTIQPSLNTLARALDAVTSAAPQPGMKRLILYVSPPTSTDQLSALQNLIARAKDQQVRIDVWIVTSVNLFTTAGAIALQDLATQTGGQYVLFSGVEPLQGLELYLSPLRSTYRLTYTSTVRASGGHTLVVQANLVGESVTSAAVPFDLNIQPPNPILVAPPQQIVRQAPDMRTTAISAFLPKEQPIEIVVEFPDGRKRPLVSTTLLVDNQKVAENTAEPFDRFTWDLRGYETSGAHLLSVTAVDSLGLSKTSLGIPVTITVVKPRFGLLPFLARYSLWVTLLAVLGAGAVLVAIIARGQTRRRARLAEQESYLDPLTQPVEAVVGGHGGRSPRPPPAQDADAYLVRLREDGEPVSAPPIPITLPEMTFGSDPMQVTRVLNDPSVSPVHARLVKENGEYILSDQKSTAGTWVNFEELTSPRRLQHGDVLHIGRLSYRFMLLEPPAQPAPKITPIK